MRFLFIIAHSDDTGASHAHTLVKTGHDAVTKAGHEARVVDLVKTTYKQCGSRDDFIDVPTDKKFNYGALQVRDNLCPAIREQQEHLVWCTHLIVVGPMWWCRYPSCFYSWMERTWTGGWAVDFSKTREQLPLYGKKVLLVMTTGAPCEFYSRANVASLDALLYPVTFGMSGCGMTVCRSLGIWDTYHMTQEQFEEINQKFGEALLNIEKRPVLQFKDPQKPKETDDLSEFTKLENLGLDAYISP